MQYLCEIDGGVPCDRERHLRLPQRDAFDADDDERGRIENGDERRHP